MPAHASTPGLVTPLLCKGFSDPTRLKPAPEMPWNSRKKTVPTRDTLKTPAPYGCLS